MFKSRKPTYNISPTTPKLTSVSLPPSESPLKRIFSPRRSSISDKPSKGSFLSRLSPERRSITPQPQSSISRRDSIAEGKPSRLRTSSLSHFVPDDLIKPPKVIHEVKPAIPVPLKPSKGGAFKVDETDCFTGSLKPSIKGGHPHIPNNAKHEFPSSFHVDRRHSGRRSSPPDHPVVHESRRTRHHSLSEPRTPHTTVEPTPKYMKAYIKEVPMKGESVALSWPLVDYAGRSHSKKPALYFDAGFDPGRDKWAIRAKRGGYFSPLTAEEAATPVSPHCNITEMIIINSTLEQWPIVVRRSGGLRCIDVFEAIFNTYNVVLTAEERKQIGRQYIERCERAFLQRCADSPGLPLYNERCGMRRVDLLRGKRIFKGLTQTAGSNKWSLHFEDIRP